MQISNASGCSAARVLISAATVSAVTGGASKSTQPADHCTTRSTPGSRAAAAPPRGPARNTTRWLPAATARTAGPLISTSPMLSSRATTVVLIQTP